MNKFINSAIIRKASSSENFPDYKIFFSKILWGFSLGLKTFGKECYIQNSQFLTRMLFGLEYQKLSKNFISINFGPNLWNKLWCINLKVQRNIKFYNRLELTHCFRHTVLQRTKSWGCAWTLGAMGPPWMRGEKEDLARLAGKKISS